MDQIKNNKYLTVTEKQFHEIRSTYGITKETIARDIQSLEDWYKMQTHLPKIELDKEWLERIFIINKCSIEKSKNRIDMLFASRNLFPEFSGNRNPVSLMNRAKESMSAVVLPRLSSDNTRVTLISLRNPDPENFDFSEYMSMCFMIVEYRQHNDYYMGDRYLYDLAGLSLGHVLKLFPSVLKKAAIANKEVVGARLAGLHFLFPTSVIEKVVLLAKSILSEKLSKRIHLHNTLEDLYKHVSKEILPIELGGNEKSVNVLFDSWFDFLTSEKFIEWIKQQDQLKSDESKRVRNSPENDLMGIPGSFRKLNVD